jgi:hypothetical protein
MKEHFDLRIIIAPCGINCNVCRAYLREKKRCSGCLSKGNIIPHCMNCKIRNCEYLKKTKSGLCYECKEFPCKKIMHIDKRYRTRYSMSLIGNLQAVKKEGKKKFLKVQEKSWIKSEGIICVHDKKVYPFKR